MAWRSVEKARELILKGEDALDACIAGVNIIEDDPNDHWLVTEEFQTRRVWLN
ncbi:MAG: hypothetical protein IPJ03_14400 [Ignavibacteriales bacterium]|nr:hypothetical protein [Ignavibacteriales bacterium]